MMEQHVYEDHNTCTPNTKSTTTMNQSNYLGDLILASPSVATSTTTTSFDETCPSDLDHFPTAIQKLTFTSCIGAVVDSSMLTATWPNESIDNELDELNRSNECNMQYLYRDTDTLIESLQEALYLSQQRNGSLQHDIELLKQELHSTQKELYLLRKDVTYDHPCSTPRCSLIKGDRPTVDEEEGRSLQLLEDEFDSTLSLSEFSPKCTGVIHTNSIQQTLNHHDLVQEEEPNRKQQQQEEEEKEEIDKLQNEISIQNQYITTLSEKCVAQTEDLHFAHDRIRQLEYRMVQQEETLHNKDTAISFQKQLIEKQQEYITQLKRQNKKKTKKKKKKNTDDGL